MGDQEVKRCTAALLEDRVEQLAEGPARDEEGERLVLVGRPGVNSGDQEAPDSPGDGGDGGSMSVDRDSGEAITTRRRRWHFRAGSAGDGRTAW